jgi:hypothetical protein
LWRIKMNTQPVTNEQLLAIVLQQQQQTAMLLQQLMGNQQLATVPQNQQLATVPQNAPTQPATWATATWSESSLSALPNKRRDYAIANDLMVNGSIAHIDEQERSNWLCLGNMLRHAFDFLVREGKANSKQWASERMLDWPVERKVAFLLDYASNPPNSYGSTSNQQQQTSNQQNGNILPRTKNRRWPEDKSERLADLGFQKFRHENSLKHAAQLKAQWNKVGDNKYPFWKFRKAISMQEFGVFDGFCGCGHNRKCSHAKRNGLPAANVWLKYPR